jgi:Polysaccharide pyruvyl transferase
MKIGVMTFWDSNDNYGQVLQCYALQKYLINLGHEVFLIRYRFKNDFAHRSLLQKLTDFRTALNRISEIVRAKVIRFSDSAISRDFDGFRRDYLTLSELSYDSYNDLVVNPPLADVYLVGSDQVWNFPEQHTQILRAFFLDFGASDIHRLSYAASFGKSEVTEDFIATISPLIRKFSYVSVREKSGIDICSQCGIQNPEWVVDPTMLLSAEDYSDIIPSITNECETPKPRDYVFVYMLANTCDFSMKSMKKWASRHGLSIVYVTGNNQLDPYLKNNPSIGGWLSLILNAKFVVTNSFHCSVFSTLFSIPFLVAPLTGEYSQMNSRMDSFFERLGIDRYLVDSNFDKLELSIDFGNLHKKIALLNDQSSFKSILAKLSQS